MKNNVRMVKTRSKLSVTTTKSARLGIVKSINSVVKEETSLRKNELEKIVSGDIRRSSRSGRRNESKKNYLDDEKAETDDSRDNGSRRDPKAESSKLVKLPETRKRSARLKAEKSRNTENKKEAISRKGETEKDECGEIWRRTRLRKRNDSEENDPGDKKTDAGDPREDNSSVDLRAVSSESVDLPETRRTSARLKTEKSRRSEDEKKATSGKDETKKDESDEVHRGNGLGKRNDSKGNDAVGGKAEADHPRMNDSKDDPKKTQNKFFKSKNPGFDASRSTLEPRKALTKKNDVKDSNNRMKRKECLRYVAKPASLRQTTLSESFNRCSKLRSGLRPRKNVNDSKNTLSAHLHDGISAEKRRSLVLPRKIDLKSKPNKGPVYRAGVKSAGEPEVITEDKDSIYDFEIELNDPEEKSRRNKNIVKKKSTRKPRPSRKKKTNLLANKHNEQVRKAPDQASKSDPVPLEIEKTSNDRKLKSLDLNGIRKAEGDESQGSKEAPVLIENSENVEERVPRVRISNVETLRGDKKLNFRPDVSCSRQNAAKFNPFGSTQPIFKPKSTVDARVMMEASLLNKSLSPIKKQLEQFDPASPWRPPLPGSFSSVKQIVQSTPQAKRNLGILRSTLGFRISEKEEEGEYPEVRATPLAKNTTKKTPNPLGVRISNETNIQNSNSKINEREPLPDHQETYSSPSKFGIIKKHLGISADYGKNKENSGFGDRLHKSPKKSEKLYMNIDESPCLKKRTALGNGIGESENMAPSTLMKQSNLNGFLNLDEMPESISINTSHGIFGDGNSTPVVQTRIFNSQTTEASVENCFGFEEEFRDVQVSPVKQFDKKMEPNVKKRSFDRLKRRDLLWAGKQQRAPRILLAEIKNTLFPRKGKTLEKLERVEERNKKLDTVAKAKLDVDADEESRSRKTDTKSLESLDPVRSSDTFDVLSENGQAEGLEKSISNDVALFTDLEPIHFTKPPRWSYAKKRERQHNWSSAEDSDEDVRSEEKPVKKKRKLEKLNKLEENKIDEWVKSVNETFQEIDEFDLVVEKLP